MDFTHLVYGLIGAAYLWPWNVMLVTAPQIARGLDSPTLAANFSSSVMTVNTVGTFLTTVILAMRPSNFRFRLLAGLATIGTVFFALTLIESTSASSTWYFLVLLAGYTAVSLGTASTQNGAIAVSQKASSPAYARSILIGQAISGILPPLLSLSSADGASLSYLNLSVCLLAMASMGAVWIGQRHEFSQHLKLAEDESEGLPSFPVMKSLAKDLKVPAATIILAFLVSLIYPVFANSVKSQSMSPAKFSSLVHLVWNAGDLSGRSISQKPSVLVTNPRWLVAYAWWRVIFVFILVALARAGNPSDILFLVINYGYGFTSGHLLSSAFSYAPTCVEKHQQAASGGLLALFIGIGLICGSVFSFVVVPFI